MITTAWKKSSRSAGNQGECVEVRRDEETIQVRDSKDPNGPILTFTVAEWEAFLDGATKGEFSL